MKNNVTERLGIVLSVIAIVLMIISNVARCSDRSNDSETPSISSSQYSDSDSSDMKLAILFLDGRKIEVEYTWSMTISGVTHLKLSDGTEIQVDPCNVILFESYTEDSVFLKTVRDKFM